MRARNLKPGFFKNPDLAELPFEHRLLYEGLWCLADCEGRLIDDPRRIKAEIFPYDQLDVSHMLEQLEQSAGDFIERYQVGNLHILQIKQFKKHQSPHLKEKQAGSQLPPKSDTSTRPAPDQHQTSMDLAQLNPDMLNPESPFLNPDMTTTEPIACQARPASKVSGSRGIQFKIKNRGIEMSEEEWLLRCFIERRRSTRQSIIGCDTLDSLLSLYPTHFEQYRRWQTLPESTRMAAYAYTVLESQSDDQLKYAINVAENGKEWEKFQPYLRQAQSDVANNDYVVVIN